MNDINENAAWHKVFTSGSEALKSKLKKVHAKNPKFQAFLKSIGHEGEQKSAAQAKKDVGQINKAKAKAAEPKKVDRIELIKQAVAKRAARKQVAKHRAAWGGEVPGAEYDNPISMARAGHTIKGYRLGEEQTDEALLPKQEKIRKELIDKEMAEKRAKRQAGTSYGRYASMARKMRKMAEEVVQIEEGNPENKAKKNEYVSNIIKTKLHPSVLPSLKYGRKELKKEEVEQTDEALRIKDISVSNTLGSLKKPSPNVNFIAKDRAQMSRNIAAGEVKGIRKKTMGNPAARKAALAKANYAIAREEIEQVDEVDYKKYLEVSQAKRPVKIGAVMAAKKAEREGDPNPIRKLANTQAAQKFARKQLAKKNPPKPSPSSNENPYGYGIPGKYHGDSVELNGPMIAEGRATDREETARLKAQEILGGPVITKPKNAPAGKHPYGFRRARNLARARLKQLLAQRKGK